MDHAMGMPAGQCFFWPPLENFGVWRVQMGSNPGRGLPGLIFRAFVGPRDGV